MEGRWRLWSDEKCRRCMPIGSAHRRCGPMGRSPGEPTGVGRPAERRTQKTDVCF